MRPLLRLILLFAVVVPALALARPERIVSLGVCSDQLLLLLADREQIAALSTLATDRRMSYFRDVVGDLPLTDASAEQVIGFRPDLVITNQFTARGSARLLRQLGYRVEEIPLARSVEDIVGVLRQVGEWTGNQQRAEQVIVGMESELERIRRDYAGREKRSIVIYSPNGFSIGADTLEDDILRLAGFRNSAAEQGIVGFQPISLETLLAINPDFIQINDNLSGGNSLATSILTHPVFDRLGAERLLQPIPTRLRICAGPMITEAIERLAAER